MLKSHLIITWRALTKSPGYALLTVGGLALGIAAAFVLGLYVRQELTHDRRFADSERIYRVATDFFEMGGFAKSQGQLAEALPQEAPAVELTTHFDRSFRPVPVTVGEQRYEEPHVLYADTTFFQMFSYRFLAGDRTQALRAPGEAVLSERLAQAYFGDAPAPGRLLLVGKEQTPYRVGGVVAPPPGKTHLAADLWLPLEPEAATGWTSASYYTYVKLRPGATQADLERGLDSVLRHRIYPASGSPEPFEAWAASPQAVRLWAQPLHDIYLHSDLSFEVAPGGNPTQVVVLGLVGLFVLLIAGVNYVNLTTARASVRAKEVGVKKTMGAAQHELVRQFLTETVLLSVLAMAFAAVFVEGMRAVFAAVTGTVLAGSVFADSPTLLVLLGFSVGVGLLAGLYPAFYLARYRPAQALKGDTTPGGGRRLRGTLVIGQFAIAIGLAVSSLVVYEQFVFMQRTDKGFEPGGVVVVENVVALGDGADAFRHALEALPQVERTSFATRIPTGPGIWMYTYQTPEMEEAVTLQTFPGDADYLPTLGMRLVAGRTFSPDLASDSGAVILNEAAVRALGLGDAPLGREVNEGQHVVGVVGDFNFQSLRAKIEPVVLTYAEGGSQLAVKLRGAGTAAFTERLPELWQQFGPAEPVRYAFLDDNFAALAAQERTLGEAVALFTLLALLIAAMGLFGLSAFAVERRTKEIGIRKVLGASASQIVVLLARDFVGLVVVAALVAAPVAYLAMDRWLDDFAYRIEIGPLLFATAGLVAVAIALLTVSGHALRAATADPVEALRYE